MTGRAVDPLAVEDVLFWYDGPVLYTTHYDGQLRLVTLVDLQDRGGVIHFIHMVSTLAPAQLDALRDNLLPLRDASLLGPTFRYVEVSGGGGATITEAPWDEEHLPDAGVLLSLETKK